MRVRFAEPTLQALDAEHGGTLVVVAFTDERPLRGLAGRIDWRLCGQLNRLLADGILDVGFGGALLCPTNERLPFDKLLVVGLGATQEFSPERFGEACHVISWKLARMAERRFAMMLPGVVGRDIALRDAVWAWRHGLIRSFDSASLTALEICVLAEADLIADLAAPMRAVADEVNDALRHEVERRELANSPPLPGRDVGRSIRALTEAPDAQAPRPRTTGVIKIAVPKPGVPKS